MLKSSTLGAMLAVFAELAGLAASRLPQPTSKSAPSPWRTFVGAQSMPRRGPKVHRKGWSVAEGKRRARKSRNVRRHKAALKRGAR